MVNLLMQDPSRICWPNCAKISSVLGYSRREIIGVDLEMVVKFWCPPIHITVAKRKSVLNLHLNDVKQQQACQTQYKLVNIAAEKIVSLSI